METKDKDNKKFHKDAWVLFYSWIYEYMEENNMEDIGRPEAIEIIKNKIEEEFRPSWDLLTTINPDNK